MDSRSDSEMQLLPVAAAAELLCVPRSDILEWIDQERIPYLAMRGWDHGYALPMHALLAAIRRDEGLRAELGGRHQPAPSRGAQCRSGIASLSSRGRDLIEGAIPGH